MSTNTPNLKAHGANPPDTTATKVGAPTETQYLSTKKAAARINHAEKTLANWRVLGTGPAWLQPHPNGKILYAVEELDNWLRSGSRKSTSDQGGGNAR